MNAVGLIVSGALLLLAAVTAALLVGRARGMHALAALWAELAAPPPGPPATFDPAMLTGLPAPAHRWLQHAIVPGTPLRRVALLRMHGTVLVAEDKPLPMTACQVLAPPHGFVWQARAGRGLMRIQGFDRYAHARGEMRWWALGVIPAVTGSGPDIDRSAAGRLAGEATLVPAALLPGAGVTWEPVDDATARVRLLVDRELVTFTVRIRADGSLERVVIERWNGDPHNGPVGFLPFVVDFEHEQRCDGYTLPVHVSAGWAPPGGESARRFFHAQLDHVEFR